MVAPKTPEEPPGLGDGSAAALLDEAEEILNSVGAQVMAEVQAERAQQALRGQGWIRRFRRRNP